MMTPLDYLHHAIRLAAEHSADGLHGPFGAVIVKDGIIIGEGWNQVVASCDPSAHAEIVAIRKACETLSSHDLHSCTLYSSCEPCPMCFGASVWARLDKVVYAETRHGAARAGFDDERLYHALNQTDSEVLIQMEHVPLREASALFDAWLINPQRHDY